MIFARFSFGHVGRSEQITKDRQSRRKLHDSDYSLPYVPVEPTAAQCRGGAQRIHTSDPGCLCLWVEREKIALEKEMASPYSVSFGGF
jgi:hypothetical protein